MMALGITVVPAASVYALYLRIIHVGGNYWDGSLANFGRNVNIEEDFAVIDFCDECVCTSIYLPHWSL